MKPWKVFVIALVIILISSIIIGLIKPYFPNVSNNLWDALSLSFGVAYLITYNLEYKDAKSSIRTQKIVTYLFALIIIIAVYLGLSFLLDKIKK